LKNEFIAKFQLQSSIVEREDTIYLFGSATLCRATAMSDCGSDAAIAIPERTVHFAANHI
jgi:hypothetical protein